MVSRVRRLAGTKKVGHAGTLDPMATGVLVLGVGRATKLLTYLVAADKTYTATIRLGASTTTDDEQGEVLFSAAASGLTLAEVDQALAPMRGQILQVPSAVSAVKVRGQRAYKRVRAGENVDLPPREVEIKRLAVVGEPQVSGPFLDVNIEVDCSSGTYIRAIARDLGEALRVGGHLTRLRRTRVGRWAITAATRLDETEGQLPLISVSAVCRDLFPPVTISDRAARLFGYGQRPALSELGGHEAIAEGQIVALVTSGGDVAGLARRSAGAFEPEFVADPA